MLHGKNESSVDKVYRLERGGEVHHLQHRLQAIEYERAG
jgi:hypothetical protein